jgi:hypothetical protein
MPVSVSRPASPARAVCEISQGHCGARDHPAALDRNVGEGWAFHVDDVARNTLVTHQDVRPTAQDLVGEAFLAALPEQGGQLRQSLRAGHELDRAAEAEPGVRGQRLIGRDDPAQVVGW